MNNEYRITNVLQSALFLLYFIILTAERIISLVEAFRFGMPQMDMLDRYMTILTLVSLCGGWLYLLLFGRKIFDFVGDKAGADFRHPSIAAGIILLGGMVHTIGTILVVQFVAYGCLLGGMAVYTVRCVAREGNGLIKWWTFAYIAAFSMAVPVGYKMGVGSEPSLVTAFYIVESITSFVLVAVFTVMLVMFFDKNSVSSFCPYVWIFTAIADAAVLWLRWYDTVNVFVLIFAALTIVLGVAGKCIVRFAAKKDVNIE